MTTPSQPRAGFRWRAFASVLIAAAFAVLTVSGVILFIAPPGRVANWTNWAILGLRKTDWAALHIVFSALFLLAAAAHVWFNWRPMLGYFKTRWQEASGWRWEWLAAVAVSLGLYAGTRAGIPPFSNLLAWNEAVRESWDSPQERAPIPHAELLTMQELCSQAAVDYAAAQARLAAQGITNFHEGTLVRDLAAESRLSAQRLFQIMTAPEARASGPNGSGQGTGQGSGGGPGRKTLAEYCASEGLEVQAAMARLTAKGFKAEPNLTLREIAVNNGFSKPYELLEILRGK